ncbi:MAG: Asp-tRNA(Asn)/Glu-tRNA(Gln) amidotransferase subunit GatA [Bdellovibrionaceae bacterium]|nr:Asp-tRNA(Asn)/Glu-tRNA(Gln) amidotransferase subunit GatA [Pseudobdellovibrionaceae bacterium]
MPWINKSVYELKNALEKKEVTAVELSQSLLSHAKKHNKKINAIISFNPKLLDEAKDSDQRRATNTLKGELDGIPIVVKDMFCTKGLKTTAASKMLENFIPPYSSTVVKNLQNAGALLLGKANQDEFAMGGTNEYSYFGNCLNPWNTDYVAGGSSGGSAASVAGGFAPLALGTDTGGSVREPAHFCGVVGLKPTYGRLSRYGVISFASSLDQPGIMGKQVKDVALALQVSSSYDPKDATSANCEVPHFSKNITSNIKEKKIGLLLPENGVDKNIVEKFNAVKEILKEQGCKIVPVSFSYLSSVACVYHIIASSEASSNLARYDGVRYGYSADFSKKPAENLMDFYATSRAEAFGEEVKRRILLGTYVLSSGYYDAYYKKACQLRYLIAQEFKKILQSVDCILSPVSGGVALKVGANKDNLSKNYDHDWLTVGANLAGLPALSVPAGFSDKGLPIGLQLLSSHFQEQTILDVALNIEENLQTYKKKNSFCS